MTTLQIGEIGTWHAQTDRTAVWEWANQFPLINSGAYHGTYTRKWWVYSIGKIAIEIIDHQHDGQGDGRAGEHETIVEWIDLETGDYI